MFQCIPVTKLLLDFDKKDLAAILFMVQSSSLNLEFIFRIKYFKMVQAVLYAE